MLYRSLLGKTLGVNRIVGSSALSSVSPHRTSFAANSLVQLPTGESRGFNGSSVIMAGSPLFVTDLSKQFDLSEIQFVLSEQV